MGEASSFVVPPYTALAGIYERAGFNTYSNTYLMPYLAHAQSLNWAGRRVLDLGCGTGATAWRLAQRGYRVTGIDNSPAMLAQAEIQARQRAQETDGLAIETQVDFVQMDVRTLKANGGPADLVLALNGTLNALPSLRELEQTFASVCEALAPGQMFLFDMWTIRGLAESFGTRDEVYYDNGFNLTVIARHQFSYETLSATTTYQIYQQQGQAWQRQDEVHVTRAFPTQGIRALLERNGFRTLEVLTPEMRPYNPQHDEQGRAVFFAVKPGGSGLSVLVSPTSEL